MEKKGLTEGSRLNDRVRKMVDERDLVDVLHLDTQKVFKELPEGAKGSQDEWETIAVALQLS